MGFCACRLVPIKQKEIKERRNLGILGIVGVSYSNIREHFVYSAFFHDNVIAFNLSKKFEEKTVTCKIGYPITYSSFDEGCVAEVRDPVFERFESRIKSNGILSKGIFNLRKI